MKKILAPLFLLFTPTAAYSQCFQNGIPCVLPIPQTPSIPVDGTMVISGSDGTATHPVLTDTNGRTITTIYSMPPLSTGTNVIGSISNTTIGAKLQDATGTAFGTQANPLTTSINGVVPISTASLPLPTGAATSALQTTMNTNLTSLVTNTTGGATASNQTLQLTPLNTLSATVATTGSPATTAITVQPVAVQPVTTANASSAILKALAGTLYSLNVENGSSQGYLIAYDGAVPTSGGALTTGLIRYHYSLVSNAPLDKSFTMPAVFSTQISVLCSSSLTTYTPITCVLITGQVK